MSWFPENYKWLFDSVAGSTSLLTTVPNILVLEIIRVGQSLTLAASRLPTPF
jgi:hypothetical protein